FVPGPGVWIRADGAELAGGTAAGDTSRPGSRGPVPLDFMGTSALRLGSEWAGRKEAPMSEGRLRGLWARRTRALAVGGVLTITFVASEALAVVTVMPVAAHDLGGIRLYGWAFSAFMLGSVIGIVAAGREADRRGPAIPFVAAVVLFGSGL